MGVFFIILINDGIDYRLITHFNILIMGLR